jgi:prephenate dehydrogenase
MNGNSFVFSAPGRLSGLLRDAGFRSVTVATPEKHDEMIAFTSQLAHVVSNAYIKSPTAAEHLAFSAGSYRDLTRVAKLNEGMWTELFMDNRDALLRELEGLIDRLGAYRDALAKEDSEALKTLLREGREVKESLEEV